LLVCLFRNNGIYTVLLSFPLLIIFLKGNRIKLAIILIIPITLNMIINNVVFPAFSISKGSVRETLSIPFQQIARYKTHHEEEFSKQDIEKINKIINYGRLIKLYNPELSDPVKATFNKDSTREDLMNFFQVWWKHLKKHPTTYIQATLNNTYGYFYIERETIELIYKGNHIRHLSNLEEFDVGYDENTEELRNSIIEFIKLLRNLPIINIVFSVGAYFWAYLIIAGYLIYSKRKKLLIILSPIAVLILTCVASPVNAYMRYLLPYMFVLPLIIILLHNEIIRKAKE